MKIAVVGVGAMGSVYAGLLADAGNEVWAIDVWKEHIETIQGQGLRVEGASGDRVVTDLHASTEVADAAPCDLFIISTKAADVAEAAASVKPLMQDDSMVLAMQNGLGSGERIVRYVPRESVLLGVAKGFGASMRGPGHVHHNGMELIRVGEMTGGMTDRLLLLEATWRGAGFTVKAYADINQLIWEKFVCNVAFSAPCTVFNRTVREMMEDPETRKIVIGCAVEAYEVGKAKGVDFSFDDPESYIVAFSQGVLDARPSMLLDHLAGRTSEVDVINGMVPVVAAEVGSSAPYNEVVSAIVRSRERSFS